MIYKKEYQKTNRFFFWIFLFIILGINGFAQITISGDVRDENGLPLPGVTVQIKGTTFGSVTGSEGQFSVEAGKDDVLVFSFVGMETVEVPVENQTIIHVTMKKSVIGLDEVVAVGYGTQKKINLTGAVGVATSERLKNRPIASVAQGLQGVVPNLNIFFRNGAPIEGEGVSLQTGSPVTVKQPVLDFNIRGFESINGGSPLVLVDGVPADFDKLNPDDIERVTVLKDAAAAAVYGARAAFGVILVETKQGKPGKTQVTLSSELSATVPIALIDPLEDPYEAALAWNEANIRTFGNPLFDDDYLQGFLRWKENPVFENEWGVYEGEIRRYGYTDYKSLTIADWSLQQKYNVNISGASNDAAYYVSFGYLDKEGWAKLPRDKNYMYKRYNTLVKAEFKINNWLWLQEQVTWSAEHYDQPHFYNWDVNINTVARVKPNVMIQFPDLPYYKEPGDRSTYEQYIGMYFLPLNALPYWYDGGRDTETNQRLMLKQEVVITPFTGFKLTSNFSYSTFHRERQNVHSKVWGIENTDLNNLLIGNLFSSSDWIRNYSFYNQYYVFNLYGEYTFEKLDNHYIKAMVGFNQEWGRNTHISARNHTLITPLIADLNATTGSRQNWGSKSHVALRGVFYRLNYRIKDKYLFEVNGLYNGTSRFSKADRFAFFPSFSAGWRISNEPFFFNTAKWLNNLKIRASYGTLGNQLLGDNYYPYIPAMESGMSPYILSGDELTSYVGAAGLVNPSLTWETVETKNLGFDISALKRLDISFDIYTRDTKDMLMDVEYPDILGATPPQSNAADLRTKGWELSVTWHDRIREDFFYHVNIGLSDNQTEITKYDNLSGAISEYYVGKKIGEIWGYVTEGIFQTDEEIAQHADQSMLGTNWRPGDIKYRDLDGDGKISPGIYTLGDHGDQKIIGNNTPRYSFGINSELHYKNWSLSIFFQGLFRDFLPPNNNHRAFYPFHAGHIEKWYLSETWSPDNPDAYFAAPHVSTTTKKNIQPQSRYMQNAAYIRLKNVTLSYQLPAKLAKRAQMEGAQLYVSGMNLWEATGMHAPLDPEQTMTMVQEYYFNRVYSLGIKLTF